MLTLSLLATILSAGPLAERSTAPIVLQVSSKTDRAPGPAFADLPEALPDGTAWRLTRSDDPSAAPLPVQVDPDSPRRIRFLLPDALKAGETRRFQLLPGGVDSTRRVSVRRDERSLEIMIGDSRVLRYNTAHVAPPPEILPRYGRSAHIHPVWSPNGTVVTDEFHPEHPHQSGVFLAYTKTEFEGRRPNFWDVGGTGRVRFHRVDRVDEGPVFGGFRVENEHVDLSTPEGKVALREIWDVRVWNLGGTGGGPRVWDLVSTVNCASTSPLELPEYHYGGMAVRGARGWTPAVSRFLTSQGAGRENGNHTRPQWCDLSGQSPGAKLAGIALLTHPNNFRSPEPVRIHPEMPYFVYTPSQLGAWRIAPGTPSVSRYRVVAHDDRPDPAELDRIRRDFAEPVVLTVVSE